LIGDPVADRAALTAVSPLQQVATVHIPILLMHGGDDRIVPISQSEAMRDALTRAGKPVQFIRIENEGHIWADWTLADRQQLLESVDAFLSQHIGAGAP
jgi:dipeptidyl aminopeptidase/acylaminoacyl peptidase